MTRTTLLLFTVLMLAVPLLAQKPGEYPRTMYVTFDRALVYADADYTSDVIDTLQLRDSVAVLGSQGKYFQISLGGKRGYVLWSNLGATSIKGKGGKEKVAKEKKETTNVSDVKETRQKEESGAKMVSTAGDSSATPGRRSAKTATSSSELPQCRAITKAGKQCSRRAADSSGYCWQHREKH